jgi:hypothetical protein
VVDDVSLLVDELVLNDDEFKTLQEPMEPLATLGKFGPFWEVNVSLLGVVQSSLSSLESSDDTENRPFRCDMFEDHQLFGLWFNSLKAKAASLHSCNQSAKSPKIVSLLCP